MKNPFLSLLLRSTTRIRAPPPCTSIAAFSSATAAEITPPAWGDSLYRRVAAVAKPHLSVVSVLEGWVQEGNTVEKKNLQAMVKKMMQLHRSSHALEISMWMTDRRYFHFAPGDAAYRLELIKRVYGLERAEKFFDDLPKQLKVYQSYGALLNCYVEEKLVEKAEDLFHKMQELNMLSSYSYNMMMRLYSDIGCVEKVHDTFQAMEEKGLACDYFTYKFLIQAYAIVGDVKRIEKLLEKLKDQPQLTNWHTYADAAKGFIRAGLQDRALELLKECEKTIMDKKGVVAYGTLLSTYADLGNKSELYRIWNVCRSKEWLSNSMFMSMISALLKMDDIEGAEAILEEYETKHTYYDFRLPNLLIGAYCMRGFLEKAEAIVSKAIDNGRTPYANTWYRLAAGYFKEGQISKAVDLTKKALEEAQVAWKPEMTNVLLCLDHFLEKKDVEAAEEIVRLFSRLVPLPRGVYHYLLRIYVHTGTPVIDLLDRMRKDGFEPDEETIKIIGEEHAHNSGELKYLTSYKCKS